MAKLKSYASAEDFSLHLAFHPTDEVSFVSTVQHLDDLLESSFGDGQRRVFESNRELEVIYWIQKPLFVSQAEAQEYFNTLRSIFNSTSKLLPHFTKFESETHD